VQPQLQGPPAPAGGIILRLRAAAFEAQGVITGIANCAAAGVLSPDAIRQLDHFYRYRVELLLETASVLESSAQTARLLVRAMERIGRLSPVLQPPGRSVYGDRTGGPTALPR
jgi:alanine dehydrogenase